MYKQFNPIGWPTILVLGNNDENIYRFQHVSSPSGFVANLKTALVKHGLYKAGKDWKLQTMKYCLSKTSRPARPTFCLL
jgi:hypothetical protein